MLLIGTGGGGGDGWWGGGGGEEIVKTLPQAATRKTEPWTAAATENNMIKINQC